jgi:excisionase family DNA binding protein
MNPDLAAFGQGGTTMTSPATATALPAAATGRRASHTASRERVALPRLGRAMGIKNIYRWAEKGFLPVPMIDNRKFVTRPVANHLLSGWRHSLTPTQARRLLGVSEGQMYGLIRRGIVTTIKVFGHTRVARASLAPAREFVNRSQEDIAFPDREGFARFSAEKHREWGRHSARSPAHHRWTSEEARAAGRRGGRSIEPRIARLSKGTFFEKLSERFPDLSTPAIARSEAARLLGVSPSTIARWIAAGTLSTVCAGSRSRVTVESIKQLRATLQTDLFPEFQRQQAARSAEIKACVISCAEASTMLGVKVWQVLSLFYKGYLRGELVEDRPMVYRSSVEARLRQAGHSAARPVTQLDASAA